MTGAGPQAAPLAAAPSGTCLPELVTRQARRDPAAIAVVCDSLQLTYGELDQRATRLAGELRDRGVGPEQVVGVQVGRRPALLVALLGVLKAGAAYLPLAGDLPASRLAALLTDAGARLLVTTRELAAAQPAPGCPSVLLDESHDAPTLDRPELVAPAPASAAYVIYTSGSTGAPKGVVVTHAAAAGHIRTVADRFGLGTGDRVLQMAGESFDVAVEQMFATLSVGARLVMRGDQPWGPAELRRALRADGVTVADLPTALFNELAVADPGELRSALGPLRLVVVGGEAFPTAALQRWRATVGPERVQVWNAYGPTETVMTATLYQVPASGLPADAGGVPIGAVLGERQGYVLDRELAPVAPGEPGELYVGGEQLARGYLHRPDLTAERFVPDPAGPPGARMYRTGDLVRTVASGELVFCGRIDDQLKVRGYRIEPGEVEAVLTSHPQIGQAAVVGRGGQLAAFLTPVQPDQRPALPQLRDWLGQRLPSWSVPSHWTWLEQLPLAASGKVDRAALPDSTPDRQDWQQPYQPPRTERERRLCAGWQRVLDLPQVGIHDHFFDLGGTSLLAGRLLADLATELGEELPMQLLFTHPTVAGFAEALAARPAPAAGDRPVARALPPVRPGDDDPAEPAPLSLMQEQVWFLDQVSPNNPAYNAPTTLRLHGPLEVRVLERAVSAIVARHEILRTTMPVVAGQPVQQVHPPYSVEIPVIDLRGEPDPAAAAEQFVAREIRVGFDISQLPLVRWTLLRLADAEYELVLVEHHLVHDGWSFALLLDELMVHYRAFSAGEPVPLPPLPCQYRDVARWQRRVLDTPAMQARSRYWAEQLAGAPEQLALPYDHPRAPEDRFDGAVQRFELPPQLCEAAREFSRREGVTLFMTMLAAYATLLHRYSGQDELCIGSAFGNRAVTGTDRVIGMFVNPVVLRCQVGGQPAAQATFRALLERIRQVTLQAHAHQELPFARLVQELAPPRVPGRNPLFQAMLNFDDSPLSSMEFAGISGSYLERNNRTAKLDLSVLVVPRAERELGVARSATDRRITMIWEYRSDLFDSATIQRLATNYTRLLQAALAAPERRVDELPLGDPPVASAGASPLPAVAGQSVVAVHQLVEGHAAARPTATAVVAADSTTTSYDELNRRANQLAHRLLTHPVAREQVVAICLPRSVEFVVAVLAVLKTGAGYLPLDPDSPAPRRNQLIEDAGATVLIAGAESPAGGEPAGVARVDIPAGVVAGQPDHNPEQPVDPDQLAYLIYTSGSTGTPKGVAISHRGLRDKYLAWRQAYELDQDPGSHLQAAAVAFDVCTGDIVRALCSGGQLVLCPPAAAADPPALLAVIQQGVTCAELLPSVLRPLVEHLETVGGSLAPLRLLAVGGESWSAADYRRLREVAGAQVRILNVYGVTEATIGSTWQELPEAGVPAGAGGLPVGGPLPGVEAWVLDTGLAPVQPGAVGEIYLGGSGLARGYHGRPDLTAGRFVPHPLPDRPGSRLYATGDLGRYRRDGAIEFLGRRDQQLKVRGFRVEPGEVEHALRSHPRVLEAVVTAQTDAAGTSLAGYVTAPTVEGEQPLTAAALRDFLRERLPAYLVPASCHVLDQLPRTSSGKLDRSALPAPQALPAAPAQPYAAPGTDLERLIAEVWQGVLGVERVGRRDDFFDLGGHSLLATQVVARLRARTELPVAVADLLGAPTVAGFAGRIEGRRAAPSAKPGPALVARPRTPVRDAPAQLDPAAGEAR